MAPPRVLVAGALHHDVVVDAARLPGLDETLPGRAVAYLCGGKGGNQAVAAAQHGAPTAMAGRVGDDAFGRTLLDNLDRAGVDRAQVTVVPGASSGMSVAIVTDSGDYGAVIVSAVNLEIDAAGIEIPEAVRLVVLQNEISEAVNLALAERATAAGIPVLLNAAPARPFQTGLRALVDLLVVNRVEAAALWGRAIDTPDEALAAACDLALCGGAAVVTLGADGIVLAGAGESPRHLPARPVDVVSTHGAGDAFVGALAARLAGGDGLAVAAGYAQAAAALHVSRPPEERRSVTPEMVRAVCGEG